MRSWRSVPALVLGLSLGSAACTPDQGNVNEDPMNTPRDLSAAAPADLNGGMTTECAAVEVSARQAPAALLVLLDRSSSMADGNKWAAAAQAIVQAIDQDAFDNMTIGLMAAPSGTVKGPQCVFNLQVSCVAPPFPQVDLQAAGTLKSTAASGVRRDIRSWLQSNTPDTNPLGDASPLYAAAVNALTALQGWPQEGKRILLTVTDGTLSCGQLANRPGFPDCNKCDHDWEDPANLVKLFDTAKKDAQKPVDSFMVGVPGAAVAHAGLNAPCDYAISGPEVVQVDGAAQVSVSVEPVSCGWPAESRRSIACLQELGAGSPTTCVPADGDSACSVASEKSHWPVAARASTPSRITAARNGTLPTIV